METASGWSGELLPTSRGPVFVRHNTGIGGIAAGGQRVLFVHGLGGESLDWADVAAELADQFDCYALDLPGFADSPPPVDGDYSLDGFARSVVDVAQALGPVHLVGNSLGGAVATRVAAEHRQLLRSLTLVSPALPDLRPRWSSGQLTVVLVPALGPLIVRAVLRADPERMSKRVYRLCYGNPSAVTAQRHAHEIAALRRRAELQHSPLVYRSSLRAVVSAYVQRGPRRLWRQAAAVSVPTLLIYGGRDRLVHRRTASRAERTFRDAVVLRFPEIGHVAHLESPSIVAGALRTFLSRADLTAPADRTGPADLTEGMGERRGTVVPVDR